MAGHKNNNKNNFETICRKVRRTIIESSYRSGACHIGSALSCVELLVDIYFNKLRKGDFFIFSKASGAAALYAVLAEKGIIPRNKVAYYLKKYALPSKNIPGVIWSGGSLGHGLPAAVGLALGTKKKVYCLMSDAELQEGTTWECLLFIKQHRLRNLEIIVDANGFQACGKINDILDLPYDFLKKNGFKIIKTIKGRGISFMENLNEWHYRNLTKPEFEKALCELSY